uniref:Uncharacterized protein n=1 Tax=Rhizophora mucronata TaxID=61149 RepID=A0A2P2NC29_RHIMU
MSIIMYYTWRMLQHFLLQFFIFASFSYGERNLLQQTILFSTSRILQTAV